MVTGVFGGSSRWRLALVCALAAIGVGAAASAAQALSAPQLRRGQRFVTRQRCTGRLVSGTVTFTTAGAKASLVRGGIVYARGTSVALGRGRSELVLSPRRRLRPGRYTLVVRHRHGAAWTTTRQSVTVG